MAESITREEIKRAMQQGPVTLIEALPQQYYDEGHLPGALQINYDEVDRKAGSLPTDKEAFIVTYCASDSCPNSGFAADKLIERGYTNVKKYVGGKKDWTESGEILAT